MRKITKNLSPVSLESYKRRNPSNRYSDLSPQNDNDARVLADVGEACTKEQYFLCAYCCCEISGAAEDTRNEHVQARRLAPDLSLDFNNIVASCKTLAQCDDAHGSQALGLMPLMQECETELQFTINGRVKGLTEQARQTIDVLRLGGERDNNRSLIEKRKRLVEALIWSYNENPDEIFTESEETLMCLIDDLLQPEQGKLQPYGPVLVNILKGWLGAVNITA
ncbi:TIGR02646 family protein [Pelagibaculum spongiae]|uniref:TIGR02646 family protein n=1 Tax=Pelagibaculum spongiae TaxID=2080658 RepID=A0A2V1GW65_9GAMM|nr:TIGR02646 family protein [Pelagibaculum spongiae]PVZ64892.1 TIGR02646 family protein [Pelagibaculum spongiae]